MHDRDLQRRTFLRATGLAALLPAASLVRPAEAGAISDDDFPVAFDGPFAHGVASGDPLDDRVIIWTRVHSATESEVPVSWEVAADPGFGDVVRSGVQAAAERRDHTVKVDVTGLSPATTYYYRFSTGGQTSIVGRTRTAPAAGQDVDDLRLVVMSCTSYWSSWWSGLGHVADRDDLDLVIHLGDYVYDFIDKDEKVRSVDGFADMRHPDNRDWTNLAECRRRYALWRSDRNLVRAHQQHPWAMVWDNHDLDPEFGNEIAVPGMANKKSSTTIEDTARVFYEWTPTRPPRGDGSGEFLLVDDGSYPEPRNPLMIYRRLRYGAMADILLTDAQSRLPKYGLPVKSSHLPSGAPSLLGTRQFRWLSDGMSESAKDGVRWRIMGTQTAMAPIDVPDMNVPGDLPKLGISRWADYAVERDAFAAHLEKGDIGRNIVVSGDTHCNIASDFIATSALSRSYVSGPIGVNSRAGAQPGNPRAGAVRTSVGGDRRLSVGVEFCPTSMGRGGADDQISGALGDAASVDSRTPAELALVADQAILGASRNVQFLDWAEHGYGLIHLTRDRAVFEFWWQDKFRKGSPDVLGFQAVTWAKDDLRARPPRRRDQINDVRLFGRKVKRTSGAPRT